MKRNIKLKNILLEGEVKESSSQGWYWDSNSSYIPNSIPFVLLNLDENKFCRNRKGGDGSWPWQKSKQDVLDAINELEQYARTNKIVGIKFKAWVLVRSNNVVKLFGSYTRRTTYKTFLKIYNWSIGKSKILPKRMFDFKVNTIPNKTNLDITIGCQQFTKKDIQQVYKVLSQVKNTTPKKKVTSKRKSVNNPLK